MVDKMNIFKKILEMLKSIFTKKEEIVMIDEGNNYLNEEKDNFKELLKVKVQNIAKTKNKVESHICYGDGLGIKKKIES